MGVYKFVDSDSATGSCSDCGAPAAVNQAGTGAKVYCERCAGIVLRRKQETEALIAELRSGDSENI